MSLLPSRKLLLLNHTNVTTTTTHINSVYSITSSSSSSAPILVEQTGRGGDRDVHDEGNSYPPPCCFNNFRLNPPFDSAMALTVLVLLTALFFMGFFSIYVRRFADENSVDPTRSRRRRRGAAASAARLPPGKKSGKGVDPAVIESLPAFSYAGRDLEQGEGETQECAICLGEFEKRERVKSIPYCGHVFHATCLDTWLSSHVTCPLCRTAELFPSAVPEKNMEGTTKTTTVECDTTRQHVAEGERDTCEEVGTRRVRRTSSWSWDGERVRLHRSLSF